MIRAPLGDKDYWDGRMNKFVQTLQNDLQTLNQPAANPVYAPQFWFDHARYTLRVILLRYSRGDPIRDLPQYFPGLLNAWELSNRLSDQICDENSLKACRDWTFGLANLNHYNWCFWLVGLALILDIADDDWNRLVTLIGAEGQDILLDRFIAARQGTRTIGSELLHRKPYGRLLKAIDAPQILQAQLLHEFVDNWYVELARTGKDELWWHSYADPVKHPLEKGSYFGRWCIEAAVAAKVFHVDDTMCLGHAQYPGDLLRPTDTNSHAQHEAPIRSFFQRLFGGSKP